MTERDVFIGALQREDPAQRRASLDGACAAKPNLRRQVYHAHIARQVTRADREVVTAPCAVGRAASSPPQPTGMDPPGE